MMTILEHDTVDEDVDTSVVLDASVRDVTRVLNDDVEERGCATMSLEDVAHDPHNRKTFYRLIARFNDEQMDCMTLLIWDMERTIQGRRYTDAQHRARRQARHTSETRNLLTNKLDVSWKMIVSDDDYVKTTTLLEILFSNFWEVLRS